MTSEIYLPDNLRQLRKRMNWSQEEMADKIGLNRGNIASYENGTAEPKICNLIKLANLFGVSAYDLIHHPIKDEDSYQVAVQRHQNGKSAIDPSNFERFVKEAEDIQSVVKGLHCLFRLKTNNGSELPDEIQFMKDHFEQLHSVTQHLLSSHLDLIAFIKSKCMDS